MKARCAVRYNELTFSAIKDVANCLKTSCSYNALELELQKERVLAGCGVSFTSRGKKMQEKKRVVSLKNAVHLPEAGAGANCKGSHNENGEQQWLPPRARFSV